jgi:hypothetical protein
MPLLNLRADFDCTPRLIVCRSCWFVNWLAGAMEASLWDQVRLPLLIGFAIQIVVPDLCFLSARLW